MLARCAMRAGDGFEVPNGPRLYSTPRATVRMVVARWCGRGASGQHGRMDACVFCRIVAGEVDADVVLDDEIAVAFLDRSPLFPGHTLVVPRRHVVTLVDLDAADVGPFFARVRSVAAAMPAALGAQGTFVANNNVVSQSVAHLHVHVVPRTKGDGLRGFFWPRQTYAEGEAARTAAQLRAALLRDEGAAVYPATG
jgi:histidine triad (HIT) family protein